jgi:predicted nuclease of restriction endonuclease-like (RecB) superfamily
MESVDASELEKRRGGRVMEKINGMSDLIKNDKPNTFFENVALIIEQARRFVGRTADLTMCATYFEIGRLIVEEEQGGQTRAEYGRRLLPELSAFLNQRIGKGYSETTLKNARKFYQVYAPSIRQTMPAELVSDSETHNHQSFLSVLQKSEAPNKGQALLAESYPFSLSWSHYLVLMRIEDSNERRFYEIEAAKQKWTYRLMQRQYGSSLYERLALSRNKEEVLRLASEGQTLEKPGDMLKNPLVLEFTGLSERTGYSESDLETAVIDKLQDFLLELGKGFLFEARQKRFSFNEKHYKVDLVTYNRLLKCYVLIDFKADSIEHQDLGQMLMYVHYFDRYVKADDEHATVGILLCKEKDDAIVELTLPEGENIYAAEYSLYLPDKAVLQHKLAEWIEEFEDEQSLRKIAEDAGENSE